MVVRSGIVKVANFVERDGDGKIRQLRCKVCGTVIGSVRDVPQNVKIDQSTGARTVYVKEKFMRTERFSELKMVMDDSSFHVTTGCDRCLAMPKSEGDLLDLYLTDVEDLYESPSPWLSNRVPVAVVTFKKGGGIQ